MESLVNRMFGAYQIVGEIGRGGMAIVYKAYQSKLDRYVAIKVLPPQFTFDPEFVKRFELEAKAAAKLKHPNIVTIFDVGEQDGFYYIAMEFVEGVSLADLIHREGSLPPARTANIVAQIASALDYAHALGYIHRDVKPSNIMVGASDHATLTDFGIVKKAAEGTRVTKSGMMMGTPEYMAPEQIRGQMVDARADVYALGIVCYEMLAGRVPFQGDTARVLYGQVNEQPPSMRTLNPRVPLAVEQAADGALAKDPSQRYSRAGEFANALSAAIGATAAASNPPSRRAPEAPTRYVTKPPRQQPSAMLPILAGVGGAVVLLLLVLAIALNASRGNTPVALAPSITPTDGMIVVPTTAAQSVSTTAPTAMPTLARAATAAPNATAIVIVVTATPIPSPTATATPIGPLKRLDLDIDQTQQSVSNIALPNGPRTQIFKVPSFLPEGNSPKDVGGFSSAAWAPSGTRVLVSHKEWYGFANWCQDESSGMSALTLSNADGSNGLDIIKVNKDTPGYVQAYGTCRAITGALGDAIWSIDGQKMAVFYMQYDGQNCPFLINMDGTGLHKLGQCEGGDHPRFWSVDGKWLIVWNQEF